MSPHPLRVGDIVEARVQIGRVKVVRRFKVTRCSSCPREGRPMLHFAAGRFMTKAGTWSKYGRMLGKPWIVHERDGRQVRPPFIIGEDS